MATDVHSAQVSLILGIQYQYEMYKVSKSDCSKVTINFNLQHGQNHKHTRISTLHHRQCPEVYTIYDT